MSMCECNFYFFNMLRTESHCPIINKTSGWDNYQYTRFLFHKCYKALLFNMWHLRIFLTGDILPYLGIVHVDAVWLTLDLLNLNLHFFCWSRPSMFSASARQCSYPVPAEFSFHSRNTSLSILIGWKCLGSSYIGPLFKCVSEMKLKVYHLRVFWFSCVAK